MPATFTLIASATITSEVASVTFSNIPSTYTHLTWRISSRDTRSGQSSDAQQLIYNSNTTGGDYDGGYVLAVTNIQDTLFADAGGRSIFYSSSPNATANSFGSNDVYIGNYTSTTDKQSLLVASCIESNVAATSAGVARFMIASKFTSTSAITSIKASANDDTFNFVVGSTFYLYGIANS